MANSVATFTPNAFPQGKIATQNAFLLFGTIAFSAGNYVTNGVPLANIASRDIAIGAGVLPFYGSIDGVSGFQYTFDSVHQTVRIYEQNATTGALVEIGNGIAVPAGVTGDVISALMVVNRET